MYAHVLQVIPSVQGLDLKALKSVLKKESCYTTILTTARIRGAEKIQIIDETFSASTRVGIWSFSDLGLAYNCFVFWFVCDFKSL